MALHLFPWTGRQVHVGSMTRHLYVRRDHERERPGAGRKSTQTQAGEGDTDSEVCGFCSGEPAAPVLSPRLGTCRHRHGRMHGDQMEQQPLALLFPSFTPTRPHLSLHERAGVSDPCNGVPSRHGRSEAAGVTVIVASSVQKQRNAA